MQNHPYSSKSGGSKGEISSMENEDGRVVAFAAWLQSALALRGLTPKGLAQESQRLLKMPMSSGHLGFLLKGEVSPGNRKVTRPTREFIRRVAKLTGADEQTGMQAAGYWPPPPALSGCHVRYVLIPEACPQDTEQILTQVAQLLASASTSTNSSK